MNWLLVFIGGGLGSLARYSISLFSLRMFKGDFPVGTFIANIVACLVLALTVYTFKENTDQAIWIKPLIVTGFCGGFSTFSTFSNESVQLFNSGHYGIALTNLIISLATGIGLIWWLSWQK